MVVDLLCVGRDASTHELEGEVVDSIAAGQAQTL